jgi:hypothetical protein
VNLRVDVLDRAPEVVATESNPKSGARHAIELVKGVVA